MVKNIIFSGGALKGWGYIGTIRALKELIPFKDIENVAGVSVGSLFAFFYVLQIDYSILLDIFINLNINDYLDINLNDIMKSQSILKGNNFKECITGIISLKIDPNITFKDLYKYTRVIFTVCCLNVSKSDIEYFNYYNSPDVKVIDTLIASCSLPLVFSLQKINGNYYCDGGLCNNCPQNLYEELDTVAFDLEIEEEESIENKELFFIDIINCMVNLANKVYNVKYENKIRVLSKEYSNQIYNFNQTKDDIFNIYMNGYNNCKRELYNKFIALPSY